MNDPVKAAIQQILDTEGEGWSVKDFVIPMGLERMNSEGDVETDDWVYIPRPQPDYVTNGLLAAADEKMHARVDEESE